MPRWMTVLATFVSIVLAACGTEAVPEAPGDGPASEVNCEVAFDEIEPGDTLTRLENNLRALDATIERCPDLATWTEMAQQELPEVDLSGAEDFIAARCEANPDLAETVLCEG